MSLFKKVARAFVVIEEDEAAGGAGSAVPRAGGGGAELGTDALANDAADLLAQLSSTPSSRSASASQSAAARSSAGTSAVAAPPQRPVSGGTPSQSPVMAGQSPQAGQKPAQSADAGRPLVEQTAQDVMLAAGIEDGPNSAQRMLKMLASLATFPPEQQKVMVQAMDAADPTWSEQGVMEDAQKRIQVLQQHQQRLVQEKELRQQGLSKQMENLHKQGNEVVAEIDKQIAELQKMRMEAMTETTQQLDQLKLESRDLEEKTVKAQHGIHQVINTLHQMVVFLGGSGAASAQGQGGMPGQMPGGPKR